MLKLYNVIDRVSKEDLIKYYIEEDHNYYDTIKHFELTDWMFNKVLDYYGIKKDRSKSCKKGIQTKYAKAGGKDNYDKIIQYKTLEKRKLKYGSIEAYNAHLSEKCSNT